jgi:dTDP-4-dehydrorhamnose 3,5-epimerase
MFVEQTRIPDVKFIKPQIHKDDRGFFIESFNLKKFNDYIPGTFFVQDNHSRSLPGVLRGIHYQLKKPQGKLIKVVSGTVYDVAVDLRKDSPTFGQWVSAILSDRNNMLLWIPPGFGHGFYTMGYTAANIIYKTTEYWYKDYEKTLLWNDPAINIDWPLTNRKPPRVSYKDTHGLSFLEVQNECF